MGQVDKYLLPSERAVVVARRHWAVMLREFMEVALVWLILFLLLGLTDSGFLGLVSVFFLLFSAVWLGWDIINWYVEEFAVTDKRVLLVSGVFIRKVAIMPLIKVTDLTYKRDLLGQILGYGTFHHRVGWPGPGVEPDRLRQPPRRVVPAHFGRTVRPHDRRLRRRVPGGPPNPTDRLPRV